MPIYTYRCENCGVQFDRSQRFSDDPLSMCPECEKETLRKVFLPVGIVFKGSGFYSTDHRSSSSVRTSSSNESDSSSKKEKSESVKKETSKSDDD
ncbi:MAG: zinc ribbon domain-containing protein [Chloroflexi bacterium]|nr:zinc ribbon domain-containing protein [Chloroflexota bacterium]